MRGKQFLNGAADRATMVDGCPLAPVRSTITGARTFGKSAALGMPYDGKTTPTGDPYKMFAESLLASPLDQVRAARADAMSRSPFGGRWA